MAAPRVPESSRVGLRTLMQLSSSESDALVAALRDTQPTRHTRELGRVVANKAPAEIASLIPSAVEALIELYIVRDHLGIPVDDFVDYLMAAISYPGDFPEVENWKLDEVKLRLRTLLSFYEVLGITSKAQYIFTDNEHTFCNARALTDVRPVFGEEVNQAPSNAVILHLLRIHYHDGNGEGRAMFFAMDSDDIDALIDVLERARSKERTLKQELDRRGTHCL